MSAPLPPRRRRRARPAEPPARRPRPRPQRRRAGFAASAFAAAGDFDLWAGLFVLVPSLILGVPLLFACAILAISQFGDPAKAIRPSPVMALAAAVGLLVCGAGAVFAAGRVGGAFRRHGAAALPAVGVFLTVAALLGVGFWIAYAAAG